MKRWTYEEVQFLKDNYKDMSDKEIGKVLDRSTCAVKAKRGKLKFYLPKERIKQTKRTPLNKVKNNIQKAGYHMISKKYLNCDEKLIIKDDIGYYYVISYKNLLYGKIPSKFHTYNPFTIQNIKLWCKFNNKSFILLSDKYEGNNKKLKWICLKEDCNEMFDTVWADIYNNRGCPYCVGKKVSLSNCLAAKNPELASEWHPTKNGDLTPYDVILNYSKDVWWECKKCGYEWKTTPNSRTKHGCKKCSESKGEKRISKYLYLKNILNEPQKKFNELLGLGNGSLSYDFYLPQYNFLIEYQGEFHDGTSYQQTEREFKIQKEHDRRKCQFANDNNIKLLEIWYWDFDNIEEILEKELIEFS